MIKHIISANQFDQDYINEIFNKAAIYENNKLAYNNLLKDKILSCVFYEPSTRTSSSFIAAMQKLGGGIIPITQGVQYSSVSKGETLEDTITTLAQYSDAIVLRHPEVGASNIAASISPVPIINAGDGAGEHPTQSLLDLYTIKKELGDINQKNITFMGDLKNGRTVHSLVKLLSLYDVKINLISPKEISLTGDLLKLVNKTGGQTLFIEESSESDRLNVISNTDAIYMTRVQKERFNSIEEYNLVKDGCILDSNVLNHMKQKSIIMHPLPRVNEIPTYIDKDPRACYFKQVKNGMYVRMAILCEVMS